MTTDFSFEEDGSCEMKSLGVKIKGTYTFNEETNDIVVTLPTTENNEYKFKYDPEKDSLLLGNNGIGIEFINKKKK